MSITNAILGFLGEHWWSLWWLFVIWIIARHASDVATAEAMSKRVR